MIEKWINIGEFNNRDVRFKKYSKYRYALEAVTPEGLRWCGNYPTAKRAYNEQFRIRQDWKYQVYDTHLGKVVEK